MDAPPPQESRAEIVMVREAPEAPKVRAAHQPWTLELAVGPLVTVAVPERAWPNAEPSAGGVLAFSAFGTDFGFRLSCASTFLDTRGHLERPSSTTTTPIEAQRGHCGGEFLWVSLRAGPARFGLATGMAVERRSVGTDDDIVWGTGHSLGTLVHVALDETFGVEFNAAASYLLAASACVTVAGDFWCPADRRAHHGNLAFDLRFTMKL